MTERTKADEALRDLAKYGTSYPWLAALAERVARLEQRFRILMGESSQQAAPLSDPSAPRMEVVAWRCKVENHQPWRHQEEKPSGDHNVSEPLVREADALAVVIAERAYYRDACNEADELRLRAEKAERESAWRGDTIRSHVAQIDRLRAELADSFRAAPGKVVVTDASVKAAYCSFHGDAIPLGAVWPDGEEVEKALTAAAPHMTASMVIGEEEFERIWHVGWEAVEPRDRGVFFSKSGLRSSLAALGITILGKQP